MYTQENTKDQTRLNKSESFAIALAASLTIYQALEEADHLPATMKAQVEESIYKALLLNPKPAEA